MPFKLNQIYKDQAGRDIRVVCVDSPLMLGRDPYPLIGLETSRGYAYYYTFEGQIAYPGPGNEPRNLVPLEPIRCHMNVYQYRDFRGGLVYAENPLSEGWFLAMARDWETTRHNGGKPCEARTIIERILEG